MSTTPDDLRERLRLYATTARQEGDATIECRTNDLLALLADRDRLQAEVERLRGLLAAADRQVDDFEMSENVIVFVGQMHEAIRNALEGTDE